MLHQWPNAKRTTMIFIKVSAALWKLRYSTSFFLNAFTNSTERFRKKTALKKIIIIKKKKFKKMFLRIWQNSKENTVIGVSL